MFEPEAEGSCVSLRGGPQLLELPRRSGRLRADAGNGECSTGGVQPTRGDVPAKTHRRVERHENRRVCNGQTPFDSVLCDSSDRSFARWTPRRTDG
jgi:hypothetical protein